MLSGRDADERLKEIVLDPGTGLPRRRGKPGEGRLKRGQRFRFGMFHGDTGPDSVGAAGLYKITDPEVKSPSEIQPLD